MESIIYVPTSYKQVLLKGTRETVRFRVQGLSFKGKLWEYVSRSINHLNLLLSHQSLSRNHHIASSCCDFALTRLEFRLTWMVVRLSKSTY